jgi:TIR domain
MDHQLAANANVLDTLLATLRGSRILLLVMSPGYHQSEWCQWELGNFLTQYAAEKHKDNVFVIDLQPVPRETWHNALQPLRTMRFWEKGFTDQASRPLGFPVPKLDEDNPYWRNVNELAHLIAESLGQHADRPPESRAAILLAETTEDLLDHRDTVAVFLRQRGVDVLPFVDYPRASRAAFVSAVQRDLARSLAFVQLLGPYEGRRPPDDPTTFVVLQADQALLLQQQRALPILQWRTPEVEPERIANFTYRKLVGRHTVQTGGIEEFKQEILKAWQPQPLTSSAPSSAANPVSCVLACSPR